MNVHAQCAYIYVAHFTYFYFLLVFKYLQDMQHVLIYAHAVYIEILWQCIYLFGKYQYLNEVILRIFLFLTLDIINLSFLLSQFLF